MRPLPTTYLITGGETSCTTTQASVEFKRTLELIKRAAAANVSLVQLREKSLQPRVLYELTEQSAKLIEGSRTCLLVNDRADIARAAGADGVHLTTRSLDARVVRRIFGPDFLIGVSTHNLTEAQAARDTDANFAVFGPIFSTPSKSSFGPPVGPIALAEAAYTLAPFPLLALGGITLENAREVFSAGAKGVAAIHLFSEAPDLAETVRKIEEAARNQS